MNYEKLKICDFNNHWSMYLHPEQYPFLGRTYIALQKEMSYLEWVQSGRPYDDEAALLQRKWMNALEDIFRKKLWPNRAEFANNWNQTHIHFIPRWQGGVMIFAGYRFVDPHAKGLNSYGFPVNNYSPYPKKKFDESFLLRVRNLIRRHI